MKHTIYRLPLRTMCLAGLGALILSGCAGSGDKYPSLAVRDAERQAGTNVPLPPPPSVDPVASDQDIAAILDVAQIAHAAFKDAQPEANKLVAAAQGQGVESNSYARAASSLATLSALRGQTLSALGSLDTLETEAATTFAPLGDIREAQSQIKLLVDEQSEVLDRLSARLPR